MTDLDSLWDTRRQSERDAVMTLQTDQTSET